MCFIVNLNKLMIHSKKSSHATKNRMIKTECNAIKIVCFRIIDILFKRQKKHFCLKERSTSGKILRLLYSFGEEEGGLFILTRENT